MSAYEKQKQTIWKKLTNDTFNKENRLIFFAEGGENPQKNLGTQYGETLKTKGKLEIAKEEIAEGSQEARKAESEETARPLAESQNYKDLKIEDKIAQAGLEKGKLDFKKHQIRFTVAGVDRSFRFNEKNTTLKAKLEAATTPSEVKYLCYKTLLTIIGPNPDGKKLGLKGSKFQINNSNLEMMNFVASYEGKPKIKIEENTSTPEEKEDATEKLLTDLRRLLMDRKTVSYENNQIVIRSKWDRGSSPIRIKDNIITYRLDPDNAKQIKEIPENASSKDVSDLIGEIDGEKNDAINEYRKYAKIDTAKFEIKDYDNYYKLDEKIASFIGSDNFTKNFHQLSNAHLYEELLTKHFGVKTKELAPAALQKIVTAGYNDRIYFPDLIEETQSNGGDGAKFKERFEALMKKVNIPTEYEGKDVDRQKLKEMYEVYLAGQKILKALASESIKERTTIKPSNELDSTIQSLEEIELKKHGSYYNFDEMTDDKFPTRGTGKVQIGLTMNAINKFKTVYKETTGQDFGDRSPAKILTTLMRGYSKEELMGRENAILRVKNGPTNNATYLIINDLPTNFVKNRTVVELCKNIDNESLEEKSEDSWGIDVDTKTPEDKHAGKVEKLKSTLSSDDEQYRKQLVAFFKSAEDQDKKGMIDHAFSDAAELDTEMTRDKDVKYRHSTTESATISAEAMADQMLNKQFVTIKENGKETKLQLYYIRNGVKVINEKNLTTYFNYLIKKGYESKQASKDFQKLLDEKAAGTIDQDQFKARFEHFYKIDENKHILDQTLLPRQIQALRAGYVEELQKDSAHQQAEAEQEKINYSPNPEFAKIQKEALKAGYPKGEIEKIPPKLIAAIGAETKGKSLESIGAGIAIPLGHDFYIGLGISNKGVGAGLGLTMQLHKSETSEVTAGTGLGVNIGKGGLTPALTVGLFPKTQIGESNVDIGLAVGTMLSLKRIEVVAMPYLSYNEDRATEKGTAEIVHRMGFDDVEKATDIKGKAAALRKNPIFSNVQNDLSDSDLVGLYEENYKPMIIKKAMNESNPYLPITAGGVGLALGYDVEKGKWNAGIALGIEIKLGEDIVYKPYRGERERLGKSLSEQEINKTLEQIKSGSIESGKIKFQKVDTSDLYISSDGEIGIKDKDGSSETKADPSNFESLATLLQTVNIGARKTNLTLKAGEEPKNTIELTVQDAKHKDIEVYIDPKAKNLGVVINEQTGQIYIPGNANNLLITRERFNYMANRTEGGAAITDVIVITTADKLDRNTVISKSSTLLENRWENGKATGWGISKGVNTRGENKIHTLSEYQNGSQKWNFENFTETVYGMNKAEFDSIHEIAKGNRTKKAEYDKQEIPENWESQSLALYKKMAVDLDNGKPAINDFPAILKRIKAENPELKINDKMAGELLTTFQHEYFVNLWSKKGKKEIIRLHKNNSEAVRTHVLMPLFKDKIVKLGLTSPATAEGYATMLTTKIQEKETANFIDNLEKLGNPPDLTKLNEIIRPIDGSKLMYSGTLVRSSKEGFVTGGPKQYQNEKTKTSTMGTIGDTTKWNIDSEDKSERDIAKIILDISSPSLSLEDRKSLKSPLATQLKAFEGTGIAIGEKNFKLVSEFLKKSDQEIVAGSETEAALKTFIEFAKQVRNTALNGKSVDLDVDGAKKQYRILELKNGASILIPKPDAESASYGECSNISLLAGESFILITKVGEKIRVAGANTNIHNKINLSEDNIKLVLGLIAKPGAEKPKGRGGKDDTQVTHDTPNTDDKVIENTTITAADGTQRQIGGASSGGAGI